ncbi:winged helix-turn-helix transcriptional regulator [Methylophaga sp.]|uniref:winged helix-turn-helix transcriptional regulator n=1 Tax=Methylophaga sp. TaxID=2024840 RepID=UPI003F6A44FB
MTDWDVYNKNCPTRLVLDRIADKWTVLVVGALAMETKRFGQLKRELDGISQKMLTQTLRGLERDGIVHRKVYPTVPPKVEYSLTALGKTLVELVEEVRHWSEGHIDDVQTAQKRYDVVKKQSELI